MTVKTKKNFSRRVIVDMATSTLQAIEDLEWAIGINLLSLKIYGTNTGHNTGKNSHWRVAVSNLGPLLYFLSILIILLIPQTLALIKVRSNLVLIAENLLGAALVVVVECELITMWYKNGVITTMMEYIKNDWMKQKTQKERDIMLKYGKFSRILTIGGYVIIAGTVVCYHAPVMFGYVLRTLTNLTDFGDRAFAIPAIYMFDAYKSPFYELVAISQFVMYTICAFCYTTVGTLFGTIVLHVSAQLENLYNRIQEMGNSDDTDSFRVEFKFSIEEHERLIRFAKLIESTFSYMLLEVITGFTVLVCIQGYNFIVKIGDDVQRPRLQIVVNISYMSYMIFIMFVYSAVGDVLVSRSERIQDATYNCKWYKLKPREAAQFIPILIRSQRPLIITAGKFAPLTLPTFATLLKTTAGYISFLLAMKD